MSEEQPSAVVGETWLRSLMSLLGTITSNGDRHSGVRDLIGFATAALCNDLSFVVLAGDTAVSARARASTPDIKMAGWIIGEPTTGPWMKCLEVGDVVHIPSPDELLAEWPEFARRAAIARVASGIAIPLMTGSAAIGAVVAFRTDRADWDSTAVGHVRLLGAVVAKHLDDGLRLDAFSVRAAQLQHALDSRVMIEQAKGFVAGSAGVALEVAFSALRAYARASNRTLANVAAAVVTNELDARSVVAASGRPSHAERRSPDGP